MLLEKRPVFESEAKLAQGHEVVTIDETFHIALVNVDSQRVERHRVLKLLRLSHSGQSCSSTPLFVLARLLILRQVFIIHDFSLTARAASYSSH